MQRTSISYLTDMDVLKVFEWILQSFCEFSPDYPALLRTLKDPLTLRASERVIQFPFVLPTVEEKTEEELAKIAEKRREQGKKLQEMAAEKRKEKVGSLSQRYL